MRLDTMLIPHAFVEVSADGLVATSHSPWLELVVSGGAPSGCWIEIGYRASYLDHLVRPLIRFETAGVIEHAVMSAPLFGRTTWIGRVPEATQRILISPVDRAGPFGFEIEGIRRVSPFSLIMRAFRNDMQSSCMSIGARLINAPRESRQVLMFARGGRSMADYTHWRSERLRPFDPAGMDAPRRSADRPVHVRFVFDSQVGSISRQTPIVASLLATSGIDWSLFLPPGADVADLVCGGLHDRMVMASTLADPTIGLGADDLVARLDPSVKMPNFALWVLAEAAAREEAADCFYGDEEVAGADGCFSDVQLKPDWSPDLEAGLGYLGQPVFWRVKTVRRMSAMTTTDFETQDWRRLALAQTTATQVYHIRRILAATPAKPASRGRPSAFSNATARAEHRVSIIIPTRNQLPLLKTLLKGLRQAANDPILEIVLVDNGSKPSVHAFYKSLANDPRIKILSMPGPFNFSAMCNEAAQQARGDCLVFLNNDIEVLSPDWLDPLVAHAMRPDIGAVGARLLFPDSSIQHAGVVVGMGGLADHVSHGAPADYAGYLARFRVAHEVGAVTGACIAVEARKFHAVKGFDAQNLPVELNDIDLCLRLAAAGWRTLMCPQSLLVHHQSATRGFSFRPFRRYARERASFQENWLHMIRDDPFFHPALSLFSSEPALDG